MRSPLLTSFLLVSPLWAAFWAAGCQASPSQAPPAGENEAKPSSQDSVTSTLLNLPNRDLDQFDERWHARVRELEADIEKSMDAKPMDPKVVGHAFGALGQHYMAHHLVDMATVCFDYAQTIDPDEVRWPYLNGFLHQIQDQFDAAAEDFETALKIDPKNTGARLRLGAVWIELGRREEAEQHLRTMLAEHPDQTMARYELGRLRLDQGQLEEAVKLLSSVVAEQPDAGVAHYALGQALRRRGDLEAAKAALEKADEQPVVFADPLLGELAELGVTAEFYRMRAERALAEGRLKDAAGHFSKAIELGDEGFQMRMAYAFVLHQSGDRQGAIAQLEAATELSESNIDGTQKAEAFHRLGLLFAEEGDLGRSEASQRRALEQDSSHVAATLALGDMAARKKRIDEAIELYDSVLERPEHKDHRRALIKRGTAHLNTEKKDAGLGDLRRALELQPEDFEHQLRWIEALEHADKEEQARQAAIDAGRQLLATPPEASRVRTVLLTRLAHKLRRYGQLEAAERGYRLALEPVPETADLRMNLADLLVARQVFDEARSLYQAVIAADPENSDAQFGEIRCLMASGEWLAAKASLEGQIRITQSGRLLHLLARLLAVAPAPVAEPERALQLANEVFNARRTPDHAATLGLALAAAGQVEQAAEWHAGLLADTASLGEPWTDWLQGQLAAFRRGEVWHPKVPAEIFAPGRG